MCVYVCVYVYMCTVCMHRYVRMYASTHRSHPCMYACIGMRVCTYVYACSRPTLDDVALDSVDAGLGKACNGAVEPGFVNIHRQEPSLVAHLCAESIYIHAP